VLSIEKESNVRTYSATADEVEASREWYVVDAAGQNLGRLATQIATVLRGKHKPLYSPGLDCGDFVIVVNADKVMVTGRKLDQKFYYRYSGYPGGLSQVSLRDQLARHPERVIEAAVKGMLARNRLRDQLIRKLKVYAGPEHPHQAQQPKPFPLAKVERPS
jgi:large subunit ribosomal protein L13